MWLLKHIINDQFSSKSILNKKRCQLKFKDWFQKFRICVNLLELGYSKNFKKDVKNLQQLNRYNFNQNNKNLLLYHLKYFLAMYPANIGRQNQNKLKVGYHSCLVSFRLWICTLLAPSRRGRLLPVSIWCFRNELLKNNCCCILLTRN